MGLVFIESQKHYVMAVAYETVQWDVLVHFCMLHIKPIGSIRSAEPEIGSDRTIRSDPASEIGSLEAQKYWIGSDSLVSIRSDPIWLGSIANPGLAAEAWCNGRLQRGQ